MDETSEAFSLRSRLQFDLKAAMLDGDTVARDAIRYLLSGIKNEEIDKRRSLNAEEDVAFLQRQAKRLQESIELFVAGNRDDLAAKERAELSVLKLYLPEELSEADVRLLVADVIAEVGAESTNDLGKVMPIALKRAAGRADGKRISAVARELLAAPVG